MATAFPYPYRPRTGLPTNAGTASDRATDCDSGVYLLSALPLVLLLAEALAGAGLWYSLLIWSWPLIIVLALVVSFGLSAAALINLTAIGVALLSLATREANVIGRSLAGVGLVANLAALVTIAWFVSQWLMN